MRGITIAGMILVNNPGSWGHIYAPLSHAGWNGLTPTDLVFPFFMFIMGISMYLSMKKYNFEYSSSLGTKIVKRTLLIFGVGLFLNYFGLSIRTFNQNPDLPFLHRLGLSFTNFENLRILGVMQRLALSYFFAGFLVLFVKTKYLLRTIVGLLFAYFVILILGNGFEQSPNNIIGVIDRAVFGASHIYKEYTVDGNSFAFDPEGLLSTIPCVAHVLIGFLTGRVISRTKYVKQHYVRIFIFGAIILITGYLFAYACPLNKKIWSSSFVLVSCGFGLLVFGLLVHWIDVKKRHRWWSFFHSFGVNPLFVYFLAGVIASLFSLDLGGGSSIKGFIVSEILNPIFPSKLASLVYAVFFVVLLWFASFPLYLKRIFIKL